MGCFKKKSTFTCLFTRARVYNQKVALLFAFDDFLFVEVCFLFTDGVFSQLTEGHALQDLGSVLVTKVGIFFQALEEGLPDGREDVDERLVEGSDALIGTHQTLHTFTEFALEGQTLLISKTDMSITYGLLYRQLAWHTFSSI